MSKHQYEIHPIANVFPMMSPSEFEALKADIKEHGLRESIVFWKNMLVDGRNRLKACEELGIEPDESELMEETDPVAWVISHNLHRRHLSETQREVVAAKLAKLKHGEVGNGRKVDGSNDLSTVADAAALLNVSESGVKRAKTAIKGGCEELSQALEQDEITSSLAASFTKAVPDQAEQAKILSQGVDAVRDAVKDAKKAKQPKQPKQSKQQSAPEPAGVPKNMTQNNKSVEEFLVVWGNANPRGRKAIWLWLCDNYDGAT
jgi:ParB-like chromosome segregation protein Spo0J